MHKIIGLGIVILCTLGAIGNLINYSGYKDPIPVNISEIETNKIPTRVKIYGHSIGKHVISLNHGETATSLKNTFVLLDPNDPYTNYTKPLTRVVVDSWSAIPANDTIVGRVEIGKLSTKNASMIGSKYTLAKDYIVLKTDWEKPSLVSTFLLFAPLFITIFILLQRNKDVATKY